MRGAAPATLATGWAMLWHWYKPNQGRKVRLVGTVAVALLATLAAAETYMGLADPKRFPLEVRLAAPVVVLVALVALGLYALNRPRVADFLIETESELAKVSWPTREQVMGSTGAVLVLVLLLGVYLLTVDKLVDVLLRQVLRVYR